MANYPTADPSFASKSAGQKIQAGHINALQDEVIAIGSALRGTLQHSVTTGNSIIASSNLSIGGNSTLTGAVQISGDSTIAGSLTLSGQPRVRLTRASSLSLNSASITAIDWDNEVYDVGGFHSTSANASAVTVPSGQSGMYVIGAYCDFANSTVGTRILILRKNGSEVVRAHGVTHTAGNNHATTVHLQYESTLSAGDVMTLAAYQDSGSTLSINAQNPAQFTVRRVG